MKKEVKQAIAVTIFLILLCFADNI